MLTLGFTNHYYTLWNVTTTMRYGKGEVINGVFNGECWQVTAHTYSQNLSMDYDAAVEKIKLLAGEAQWDEDLSLRGDRGRYFETTKRMIAAMAEWQFTFGRLDGSDIRTATDVWQLNRAMNEEIGGRRRVYARRRLLELGELVRYNWTDKVYDEKLWNATGEISFMPVVRKYATPKQVARFESQKAEREMSGHFFTDGAKIGVEIKEVGGFSFETAYGMTFVRKYVTTDGKMLKYMGANPPSISTEEFISVRATVKHSEYKGLLETKLQRIKTK